MFKKLSNIFQFKVVKSKPHVEIGGIQPVVTPLNKVSWVIPSSNGGIRALLMRLDKGDWRKSERSHVKTISAATTKPNQSAAFPSHSYRLITFSMSNATKLWGSCFDSSI